MALCITTNYVTLEWLIPPIGEKPYQIISLQQQFGQKAITKCVFQAKWFSKHIMGLAISYVDSITLYGCTTYVATVTVT